LKFREYQNLRAVQGSFAKRNYAFCFFFWKKKSTTRLVCLTSTSIGILGASPQTPLGRLHRDLGGGLVTLKFREYQNLRAVQGSSAKRNYAFCFFFWKKKSTTRLVCLTSTSIGILGASPQTPLGRLRRDLGGGLIWLH
jgi:hypothetical protein